MERTPVALAKVRAGQPQEHTQEQLAAVIAAAMEDPVKLCITDISATCSNTYEASAPFGFCPGRFSSNASNGLSRKVAAEKSCCDFKSVPLIFRCHMSGRKPCMCKMQVDCKRVQAGRIIRAGSWNFYRIQAHSNKWKDM